jgi:hypothetical protein
VSERTAARAFGALFLLLGILGLAGGTVLLRVVHVMLGVIGLVVPRPLVLALGSLALWLLGVSGAGGLSLDLADNWLHFLLGVALLGLTGRIVRTAS